MKNQIHTGCLDDAHPLNLFYNYTSMSAKQLIITKAIVFSRYATFQLLIPGILRWSILLLKLLVKDLSMD